MESKDIVEKFYKSDAFINPKVMMEFLHQDVILEWNSSRGFLTLSFDDIVALSKEMSTAYAHSDVVINEIIEGNDKIVVRYAHFVETFENPKENVLLANFITIWQIKDNKLFSAYQMSQFG